MPHVIEMKNGTMIIPFDMGDMLQEIDSCMGPEVRQYIEEWKADVEEERKADRYDREEAEKELEQVKDHNHSVLCDIREVADSLEELLQAERMDRKKIQQAVRNISRMVYQEL